MYDINCMYVTVHHIYTHKNWPADTIIQHLRQYIQVRANTKDVTTHVCLIPEFLVKSNKHAHTHTVKRSNTYTYMCGYIHALDVDVWMDSYIHETILLIY